MIVRYNSKFCSIKTSWRNWSEFSQALPVREAHLSILSINVHLGWWLVLSPLPIAMNSWGHIPCKRTRYSRCHICLKEQVGMQQFCLLLWGLTPPFYFLFKDSRGHHLHKYHNDYVNSQSQESQQHPQSDLASSQQVQTPNWKRKQSIFPCQYLQSYD